MAEGDAPGQLADVAHVPFDRCVPFVLGRLVEWNVVQRRLELTGGAKLGMRIADRVPCRYRATWSADSAILIAKSVRTVGARPVGVHDVGLRLVLRDVGVDVAQGD